MVVVMNPGENQLGEMSNTAPSRGRHHTTGRADGLSLTGSATQPMSQRYHSSNEHPFELFTALPSRPNTIDLHDPSLSLEEYIAAIGEDAFLDSLNNPPTSPPHIEINFITIFLPDALPSVNESDSTILASSPLQGDFFFLPLTPPYSQYSDLSPSSAMSDHPHPFFSPNADKATGVDEEAFYRLYGHSYIQSSQASQGYVSQAAYPQTIATMPYSTTGYVTAEPVYTQMPEWQARSLYSNQSPVSYSTSPPTPAFPPLEPHPTHSSTGSLQIPEPPQAISGSEGSGSPNPADLHNYGYQNHDGTWRCGYPGCSSKSVFTRGCDLRKHFNRHTKSLFCRHEGCPQSTEGGFSSKKDRARHEAKHNPSVVCEFEGCHRFFSRVDNMKDHMRRIHRKPSY